jgi:hypothetical protein
MDKREKAREVKPTAGREEVSRRQFLQAAEVAAWSLFGVLGLDAVTERVAQRIAEMQGIDRLADQVAQDLRRNGAAYADAHCGT